MPVEHPGLIGEQAGSDQGRSAVVARQDEARVPGVVVGAEVQRVAGVVRVQEVDAHRADAPGRSRRSEVRRTR